MLKFRTILVPVDFSPVSETALEVAHALARDHQGRMVLLHVAIPPAPAHEVYVPPEELTRLAQQAREQLEHWAHKYLDVPTDTRVMAGEPGPAIVSLAGELSADLIVMGTHGRTGLMRLLMGSVAEWVLRHAPCPVLTVRPHTRHGEEIPTDLTPAKT
ncbi:MAG: universal stress protein [Planctomycetaceae bacterium]|nr:MAG: universal stress protein [Planctomycetaceae bacterium]